MTQSYATHRRLDPGYHYWGFGLLLACIALAVLGAIRGHAGAWTQLLLLAFLALAFLKIRLYALRVQDRVIRLEETLRMRALLPESLRPEIDRLRPGQFVALRFASDGELAARVEEALRENLGGEAIKKRIQTWRPDEFRV
ncbi:DUF6526 family protein [Mesoterricola silvestris]|uniref:Uncharacterized protein n=1 Tax=Mesoterricola silvestris TaxID=2927979 RepID=A0AA48GM82_9BACT|nr:DUF6526 family protein [Mesoterricola silvestris]BDU72070.1 hypothetical protein METEAL_12440 [Mesoterricola silvestris]